ncbi:hypothetical protein [Enterovibrio norvegicus]|uniref:hypothetical protein n=1 Tax=Enterovibrio norvegicus TaxID=188144 RepID=UPI000C83809A|nr:hypothetical protein [Enterovibrio norvegicus]PMH64525.1 hypothetical protein BCU62_15840 [Enterovibrio norvegicus]
MKFSTENRNSIYAASMGKLFKVEELALDATTQTDSKLKKKGLICVCSIQTTANIELMAKQYANVNFSLSDSNSEEFNFLDVYIESMGMYFQVAAALTSVMEANAIMMERKDISFMDTICVSNTKISPIYLLASNKPSTVTRKELA